MTSLRSRKCVLLVHGLNDTRAIFQTMAPSLIKLGWWVYDLNLLPSNGELPLDKLAQQVADYVNVTFTPEQKLSLIGFSMGGIVSRYYIQRLGGIERVKTFISIASPHQGTWMAHLFQSPGCVQMRPNSAFLQDLDRDVKMLAQLNMTSIWTPYDLIIVPANSSELPVGKNIQLPVLRHDWMVTDARCLEVVAEALENN